jgi:hypothetical protein
MMMVVVMILAIVVIVIAVRAVMMILMILWITVTVHLTHCDFVPPVTRGADQLSALDCTP